MREIKSSSGRESSGDSGGSYAVAAAKGSTSSKTGGTPFKPVAKPLVKAGIRGQSSRSPSFVQGPGQGSRPNRESSRGASVSAP
eukprot:6765241-Karenia_brevis.AAC.1